jgi:hypothetical protein
MNLLHEKDRKMNRLVSAWIVTLLAGGVGTAWGDLCDKCKDQAYIMSAGQCADCKGWTGSGAFRICAQCSKKLGECEHCRAKLKGAPGGDKVRESTRPADANAPSTRPAEEKGKTDPPGLPLEARLVLKTDTYKLDPKQQGKAFRDSLPKLDKQGPGRLNVRPPEPPTVDITFELKNTGTKDISVVIGGDMCSLDLKLEGRGAVTAPYQMMMTMEYRMGKKVTIEPGKSLTIPIKRLTHGMRGVSSASYWTEPGDYTLSASYRTPVEGLDLKPDQGATIFGPPVKIKVVAGDDKTPKTQAAPGGESVEK